MERKIHFLIYIYYAAAGMHGERALFCCRREDLRLSYIRILTMSKLNSIFHGMDIATRLRVRIKRNEDGILIKGGANGYYINYGIRTGITDCSVTHI